MALIETVTTASGQTTLVNGTPRLTVDTTGVTVSGTFAGGSGYPAGVRQIVYASTGVQASGSATIPFDNTTPQITEGWEVLTCSITPQSSTSALIVTAVFNGSNSSSGQPTLAMAIFRDSNANAIGTTLTQAIGQYLNLQVVGQVRVISGSTAATTFRMRVGLNVGTSTVNGQTSFGPIYNNNIATSISIIEVGA